MILFLDLQAKETAKIHRNRLTAIELQEKMAELANYQPRRYRHKQGQLLMQ